MFQVHRTDTGQFVLIDPTTGAVVIEDELLVGYERLEALAAERPKLPAPVQAEMPGPNSAFEFKGSRNLTLILTIGLPFVWFMFVYLALHSLDRGSSDELEALEAEVQSLRSQVDDDGKQGKATKPKRSEDGGVQDQAKSAPTPKPQPAPRMPTPTGLPTEAPAEEPTKAPAVSPTEADDDAAPGD